MRRIVSRSVLTAVLAIVLPGTTRSAGAQVLAGKTFTIDELSAGPLDPGHTTATLRGRLRTFRDGKQVGDSRYLHVYVLREGRWQIVAAQGTLVRPASLMDRAETARENCSC